MTTKTISKELLVELLEGVERPEDLLDDKGLVKELKVRLMERMLGAELTEHLGYEPHGEPVSQQSNRRNGATRKVVKGNDGAVPIDIPRDRDGSFEPELIHKGQTRIDGMDDKITHCPAGDCTAICRGGLYAAGLRPAIFAPIWKRFTACGCLLISSAVLPMLSRLRYQTDRTALWNRCTRLFPRCTQGQNPRCPLSPA